MREYVIHPMVVGINETDQGVMTYLKGYGKRIYLPIYVFYLEGGPEKILVDTGLEQFMVPPGVENIKMVVKNGSGTAGEVRNVSISVNGVEVVSSSDLRATSTTEKPITYRRNTYNTISVTLKGEGGSAVVVEMYGDMVVAPPPPPPPAF